jgi:hypothetical protein
MLYVLLLVVLVITLLQYNNTSSSPTTYLSVALNLIFQYIYTLMISSGYGMHHSSLSFYTQDLMVAVLPQAKQCFLWHLYECIVSKQGLCPQRGLVKLQLG